MDEKLKTLHDLCEELNKELEEVNDKIKRGGGMSAGDLETIDKLSHALKSIKTTIAMMESDEDGYSGYYPMRYYGNSYNDGMGGSSYRGGNSYREGGRSYARGRMNARRDSMGRYSRGDGYSYDDGVEDVLSEIEGMMPELPAEKRRKVQKLMDELRG